MPDDVRIAATGIAECVSKGTSPRRSMLRPYKYNKSGEGAGRSAYYQYALKAIRQFHRSKNDRTVLRDTKRSLDQLSGDPALTHLQRTRLRRNADAINAYEKIYGDRRFELLPRHRLQVNIAGVTVTAQPDLWVRENNTEVIIKIGVHKKTQPVLFMELMLHLLRKAAIATGYRVRARNVAFLDVTTGDERISKLPLSHFNRRLRSTCREILRIWPDITSPTSDAPDSQPVA